MAAFRAVIFDWRGTLVTTLAPEQWVRAALVRLGRAHDADEVGDVWARIADAAGQPDRLDARGIDADAGLHRTSYYAVFADAGLDQALADALYAVESDHTYNRFAVDAADVLRSLQRDGCRIAVLSDIHFDVRPAFVAAGLAEVVDCFVLSYEHGVQKPDPGIFELALAATGRPADETLMVGDRAVPDGGALSVGITTLLLTPLTTVTQRRLHLVQALVDGSRS
jgi:FMN phosphatase YigB (HAD superfamily)